jgi:carboxymethylenebutenolidase
MPAGQDVEFPSNGGRANGYLAVPASGSGPGVVVIQEWWGLNDQIRGMADRFADEGFVALAPDFYHGRVVSEPDEAEKLLMALNIDQFAKDARGAAEFLSQHPAARGDRVGVVGFCMGGQLALMTGTVAPDTIGAVVDMYGVHPNVKPDFSKMRAPVLAMFAELDSYVPPDARAALARDLEQAGVRYESHVYPGVDHAFMNENNVGIYNEEATEDAWRRILAFLRRELR